MDVGYLISGALDSSRFKFTATGHWLTSLDIWKLFATTVHMSVLGGDWYFITLVLVWTLIFIVFLTYAGHHGVSLLLTRVIRKNPAYKIPEDDTRFFSVFL